MPVGSTIQFAQTRIDIADFHTTLYYLHGQSELTSKLGIHSPNAYAEFYQRVFTQAKSGCRYREVAGQEGRIFDKLYSLYQKDKFWQWYVPYASDRNFWRYVWPDFIPLKVSVSPTVSYVPQTTSSQVELSPIPWVLLFPFGWSNWLSLLINGKHSLASLSSMVKEIVDQPVFQLTDCGRPQPIAVLDLFDVMSNATLDDAFNANADVRYTPELLTIVTVLVKGTGSLSTTALDTSTDLPDLKDIVCPASPGRTGTQISHQIYEIEGPLNFIVWDKLGRFIWFYRLLDSRDKGNYPRLNCYHRNTFQSLILGWHQVKLLEEALRVARNSTLKSELVELLRNAITKLQTKPYKSAGLHPLLDDSYVNTTLASASQKFIT